MQNHHVLEQADISQSIEHNTKTIAWAAVLIRKLVAQSTGRSVEDIPISDTVYCARECCSDEGKYGQYDRVSITQNAQLIADTSGLSQKLLAEALSCTTEEIPIKQVIALSLEAIRAYEHKKFYEEVESRLLESQSDSDTVW